MQLQPLNLLILFTSLNLTYAAKCNRDNCLRALAATPTKASSFCATYTQSTNTATSIPTYGSYCANQPSRVSSACSCGVTSPPSCTPSPVILGPVRNGGFDLPIPSGTANPQSQPPWYFDRESNAYGDFQPIAPGSGAATFHLQGQLPNVLPGAVAYLNVPIAYCNQVTYAFTITARQIPSPASSSTYQSCRLSIFTDFEGTIADFEMPAFSDQFQTYGPVTRAPFRDNGVVNAKGEYEDLLSVIVQCTGTDGQEPVDTLFQVDSVSVVPVVG